MVLIEEIFLFIKEFQLKNEEETVEVKNRHYETLNRLLELGNNDQ